MRKFTILIVTVMLVSLMACTAGDEQTITGEGFIPADNEQTNPSGEFTLEDLETANTVDAVFAQYSSVRVESRYYDLELPDDGSGIFSQTSVHVNEYDEMTVYVSFSDGYSYSITSHGVRFRYPDGTTGIFAFFDDGFFEQYYLPYITDRIKYAPEQGEKFVTSFVEDGVRTLITHTRASDMSDAAALGIQDGIIETIYEMDAETGLISRIRSHLLLPGTDPDELRLISDAEIFYGQDDRHVPENNAEPIVGITQVRTVSYIRDPGTPEESIFTFTVPIQEMVVPSPAEEYQYFSNAECTVPYQSQPGDYPEETIIYMKKI